MRSRMLSFAALCAATTAAVLSPTTASALPDCNGANANAPVCQHGHPPTPKSETKTGSIFPAYIVLTTLYDPPGIGSEVDYGQGSSTGTQYSDQSNFKAGANIAVTAGVVTVGAGFNGGPINGTTFTVSKQKDTLLSLASTQNQMSHQKDVFYLWVNPQIDLSQTTTGSKLSAVSTALTSKGGSPLIVPVTAEEIQNPSLLPQYKKDQLKALKAADFAQILSFNPLVAGGSPATNPKRYIKQQTLQLDGPDQPGDPLTGAGIDVIAQQMTGTTTGWSKTATASIGVTTGFSFFGLCQASVQANATFEWDTQATNQQNSGTNQSATVKLVTNTVGFHDVIDVYLDTLFNSFVFVSETGSTTISAEHASLSGHVMNAVGKPVVNQLVEVTLADGSKRPVFTNAHGIYRVFRAPNGAATVSVKGAARVGSARITGEKTAVADVVLGR